MSTIRNRTIFTGDNLHVLRGMESVDLIYLDPPFNSNANYAAPIGSAAADAAFKDTWMADAAWHGELAEERPTLYHYLKSVRRSTGSQCSLVSDLHGGAAVGDAARAEGDG